jgi:hypothetical protein
MKNDSPGGKTPTKPQLLDIGFRLMGFQFSPKMTELIYETVTLLNKKGGKMDMLDTANIQAANEDKYPRKISRYAYLKGKRSKPSTLNF